MKSDKRILILAVMLLMVIGYPAGAKELPPFAKTYSGEVPGNLIQVRFNTAREGGEICPAGRVDIWIAEANPFINDSNPWTQWEWKRTTHDIKGGARYRVVNDGMAPDIIRMLPFMDQRYSKMGPREAALHLENKWPNPKWAAFVIVPASTSGGGGSVINLDGETVNEEGRSQEGSLK